MLRASIAANNWRPVPQLPLCETETENMARMLALSQARVLLAGLRIMRLENALLATCTRHG
jgi:hypothetical protein